MWCGSHGPILARDLYAAQKPFVIIDSDERLRHAAEAQGYRVINGDATEEYILEQAGIRHAAVLATVLSADTTNVIVTITAREMNPDVLIIARGENPRTEKKLLGCGANRVVLPTAIGATKVAQLIIRPTAENMLEQITHQSSMQEELGTLGCNLTSWRSVLVPSWKTNRSAMSRFAGITVSWSWECGMPTVHWR